MSCAPTKQNKLIAIGYLGGMVAYLNVPMEEARKRYTETELVEGETIESRGLSIMEIEFNDEFECYSITT